MDKILKFWTWFKENEKSYRSLQSVDEDVKEELLEEFEEQLHNYCDKLYFEIGGFPEQDQELIITAEGDKSYFDKVEHLINTAPDIRGWTFISFKPPMPEHFRSKWDDLKLDTEEMWFLPLTNGDSPELGIPVCFPNQDLVKNNETLTPLLYKMLDTILGEKSFALDVHYVDTDLLPNDPDEEGLLPILELPAYIQWHKSQYPENTN